MRLTTLHSSPYISSSSPYSPFPRTFRMRHSILPYECISTWSRKSSQRWGHCLGDLSSLCLIVRLMPTAASCFCSAYIEGYMYWMTRGGRLRRGRWALELRWVAGVLSRRVEGKEGWGGTLHMRGLFCSLVKTIRQQQLKRQYRHNVIEAPIPHYIPFPSFL